MPVLTRNFWMEDQGMEQVRCEKASMNLRKEFLAAIARLNEDEKIELWKELEKDGIIKTADPDCV